MGLFDRFTAPESQPAQTQESQQQQPTPPGNMPDPNNPAASPTGTAPVSNEPESPLAAFEKMWETNPETDGNGLPAGPQKLDGKLVQEIASKQDFSSLVPAETLQAVFSGDPEQSGPAFVQALNSVAQNVLYRATMVSDNVSQKAISAAMEQQKAGIPELVRSQSIKTHTADTHPLLNNPAISPMVEITQQQFATKFPNATPDEILQKTVEYFTALGETVNPAPQETTGEDGQNWATFLQN